MVGCVHYRTVHLDVFAVAFSGGIKFGFVRSVGAPVIFDQPVIVFGIDEGELSTSKRDTADGLVAEFKIPARIEVGAGLFEENGPPPAGAVGFLHTHQGRAVGAH